VAPTIAHPEVPDDLINVLDTFQHGYPLDENPRIEPVMVAKKEPVPVGPKLSTGAQYIADFSIPHMGGIPDTLMALLDQYVPVTQDQAANEPLTVAELTPGIPVTVVADLPRVAIPALPRLGTTMQEMQELRQAQIEALEVPTGEDALEQALADQ
jgi:hypothetical protein